MNRAPLLLALVLLAALAASVMPAAEAVPSSDRPAPAVAVADNVKSVRYQTAGGNQVQYDVWFNFTRSSADPGTWNYSYEIDPELSAPVVIGPSAPYTIANRPRWVGFRASGSSSQSVDGSTYAFRARGFDGTDHTLWSCQVTVNLYTLGSHSQCGEPLWAAPNVTSVTVSEALSVSTGKTTIVFKHSTGAAVGELSVSDPNATTTGDFRYQIVAQFISQKDGQSTTVPVIYTSQANVGSGGSRSFDVTYAGSSAFYLALEARALDPRTGLIGTSSCQTVVDTGVTFSTNRCGLYVPNGVVPSAPAAGTPEFPFVNMTQAAGALGVTTSVLGLALGGFLIVMGALAGGLVVRNTVGGFVGAVLGLGFGTVLNLVPLWLVVLVFLGAVSVVVFMGRGGGGE